MITPETYHRRSFPIEAVRVDADNMAEVAKWCLGKILIQKRPSQKGAGGYVQEVPYIEVDVQRPLNPRQTMAFVGDWVLKTGNSFKIYSDIAFHKNFEKKPNYDDILLPENESEFMVLRNGRYEVMTPEELKEKLAPVVRATLDDIQHEQVKVPEGDIEEHEVPQVRLALPKVSGVDPD